MIGCRGSRQGSITGSRQGCEPYLVGEGAGHDERGVACGASQVQETALSQDDDTVAVWEDEAVHLQKKWRLK